MIIREVHVYTKDSPERPDQPVEEAEAWRFRFVLASGEQLVLHMGDECRQGLHTMLMDIAVKAAEGRTDAEE